MPIINGSPSSSSSAARRIEDFRPVFIAELIPTQIAFATPLVFILGAMGLHALTWRRAGALAARVLIKTMFWTIVAYFVWHSLHARVEANWFAPVYPAFVVAAAVAANLMPWKPRAARLADFCLRWAAPSGIVMFAALIVQANTGLLSGYRRDATVRSVGVGWRELAPRSRRCARAWRDLRARAGLRHDGLARLLSAAGHLRGAAEPAHPLGQHARARSSAARGQVALCRRAAPDGHPLLNELFARVEQLARTAAQARPARDRDYDSICSKAPKGDVLDRSPPPEARSRRPDQSIISALAAAWLGLSWSRQNQTVTTPERPRTCVSRGPDRTPSGAP